MFKFWGEGYKNLGNDLRKQLFSKFKQVTYFIFYPKIYSSTPDICRDQEINSVTSLFQELYLDSTRINC